MSGAVTAAVVGGGAYLATAGTAMAIGAGTAAAIGLGAGAMKNQYDQGKAAQASSSQQAVNRANQATPDTAVTMAGAGNKAGGSTLLTGAAGVNPKDLMLGKNTLLGS